MNDIDHSAAITPAQWRELERIETKVLPGRFCGSCSLCCKVVSIPELAKAAGEWCRHCKPGSGCGIHTTRPFVCRGAYCEWMISKGLGPEWKPERSKFALFLTNGGRRMTAHVDPGSPSAWKRSPYYENFKQWAREGIAKSPDMHLIDVMIGERCIVVLPERDVDLGEVDAQEQVTLVKTLTPTGTRVEVRRGMRAPAFA